MLYSFVINLIIYYRVGPLLKTNCVTTDNSQFIKITKCFIVQLDQSILNINSYNLGYNWALGLCEGSRLFIMQI